MAGWATADLYDKFLLRLGRGNGGLTVADELWTAPRIYDALADAQEAVYADMAPMVPNIFVSPPVQLTTSDGGVTYDFATFPFGHVEVYARESAGRQLVASTYSNPGGDFIFEGMKLRSPGNRARTYLSGPWARYTGFPARISASVQPSLNPEPSREMILYKALIEASDVWGAALDGSPFVEKYVQSMKRWVTVFRTQDATAGKAGMMQRGPWWLTLDSQL